MENAMEQLAVISRKQCSLDCQYLLTVDSTKIVKGEKLGYRTRILYLSPSREAGKWNMCPWSDGCEKLCLGHTSGHMVFSAAKRARIARTRFFMLNRAGFYARICREIENLMAYAKRKGLIPCVRLNGSSDIPWESVYPDLFTRFHDVQFYDYTKSRDRVSRYLGDIYFPTNYCLVYSVGRSLQSVESAVQFLRNGGGAAVVFDHVDTTEKWYGFPIIDGDISDVRFRDPRGSVIGLKAKGAARKDHTAFVVRHDF
jgi:hypothetical protein